MRILRRWSVVVLAGMVLALGVHGCEGSGGDAVDEEYWEGAEYDELYPGAPVNGGKEDGFGAVYEVPTDLPVLVDPEIIVSLDQLTVHLFDRHTGFSEVYPVGVGVINSDGVSITPTGHFASGPDTSDGWWYIARRGTPEYFGGWPFLRLTIQNSQGYNTYGLHGPITSELIRGYVSHGCMRMVGADLIRLFYLMRYHPDTPVTIQREPELDAAGNVVDLDTAVSLWPVGTDIEYGPSVGDGPPRDDTGTDLDGCADDPYEGDDPAVMASGNYVGLVMCRGDRDAYLVNLSAGDTLTVTVNFTHSVADLDVLLTDANEVVVDRSTSTSDQETVTVTAPSDGTYMVQVFPYGDAEDTGYTMTVAY
jgi:L,D-transpeptidase catalytic domain/Bacterial pre-peptidase C-terminal domain